MLGAIAGDIIGSIHEGAISHGKHFTLFTPRSRFTDDSVLTVAIAHGLRTGMPYDAALRQWARRYPTAGYGAHFQRWFEADGAGPYNSYGNGSAMRVAPVAWAFDSLEEVTRHAEQSATVTHNHPEGIRGAVAIAEAIHFARGGATKEQLAMAMAERHGYDCRISLSALQHRGGFDVSCQGTVPSALAAVLHSTDFEDAVRIAVSLGGDTDTLACIAGAVAEALYRDIPAHIQAEAFKRLEAPLQEEVRLFASAHQLAHLAPVFPELHVPRQVDGNPSGVLVECFSVLVRVDAIHRRLSGGWRTFVSLVPNQTLCCDMELARVGFQGGSEALAFIDKLEQRGLKYLWEGHAVDIALADPVNGLHSACDWLHLQDVRLTTTGSRIRAACLRGAKIRRVSVPEGWTFRTSMSRKAYYQPPVSEADPKPKVIEVNGGPA